MPDRSQKSGFRRRKTEGTRDEWGEVRTESNGTRTAISLDGKRRPVPEGPGGPVEKYLRKMFGK